MKPLPHEYDLHLSGDTSAYGLLTGEGLPELRTASPKDFDGPGDAWTPEHLLLAAIEACFLFTFRAMARASKVEYSALALDSAGTVDRQDGVTRFTDIRLRARLTVPPGTDRDRAQRLLEKAERGCLVSASLSTPVHLDTEIVEG